MTGSLTALPIELKNKTHKWQEFRGYFWIRQQKANNANKTLNTECK